MSTHNLCFSQRNKCDTYLDTHLIKDYRSLGILLKYIIKISRRRGEKNLHIPKSMDFTFCVNHLHAMEMIHAKCEVP